MPSIAGFHNCCGARIIYNFWKPGVFEGDSPKHVKSATEVDKYLKAQIRNHRGFAFLMAILNDVQRPVLHETFINNGFEALAEEEGLHGQVLTLYVKKNHNG